MKSFVLAALLSALPVLPAVAQQWALDGYDPVGYLQDGRAIPGRGEIATTWQGRVWHFATEQNRALFEADPRAFAPAFDGLCPVTLSEGRKEKGNPQIFSVSAGRLYLMRSEAALGQFRQDPEGTIAKAQGNWRK